MDEAVRAVRFGAFTHRNFRLFFFGQGVSLIGTWMQNVAQGWLVLELTNSPFYVGLVSALGSLGVLLLTIYGGIVADRVNKHRLVIITQALSMLPAFALAALVWSRAVAVWQALFSIFGFPYLVMMPVFARDVLHRGAAGYGVMMTAVGIGALLGALGVATLDRRIRKGPTLIVAGASFGVLLVAFALSRAYTLSVVLLAVTGGTMIVNNALANATIQTIVPDQLRGRVMGFYSFVFVGLAPLVGPCRGQPQAAHVVIAARACAGGWLDDHPVPRIVHDQARVFEQGVAEDAVQVGAGEEALALAPEAGRGEGDRHAGDPQPLQAHDPSVEWPRQPGTDRGLDRPSVPREAVLLHEWEGEDQAQARRPRIK